jgi:hypothetical protein
MTMKKNLLLNLMVLIFVLQVHSVFPSLQIKHNEMKKTIEINDETKNLSLTISYQNRCLINQIKVLDHSVLANNKGVASGIKIDGMWETTLSDIKSPVVDIVDNQVTIKGIIFGPSNNLIQESWIFHPHSEFIDWTIERKYQGKTTLEDTGFPIWTFDTMDTWTGALLGTGGVAWCKLFDQINASLGNHTGDVTFWSQKNNACLKIETLDTGDHKVAIRFARQSEDFWTLNYSISEERLKPKHFLARFINNRQDIWAPFDARNSAKVTYRLSASKYDKLFDRGYFAGFNGETIHNVLNTIGRVGVIDENIIGSNNWHVGMGYAVLHEQWIAQMGLAINDLNYFQNYKKTLNNYRDNAINPDGRVKSRWGYRIWDSRPGTFQDGFYEAQWGDLLDSNTDYVINVSELFQLDADLDWLKSHKTQCEKVLDFLINRDSDNDGLVEMMTDSYKDKKGSDWIDVIWASYENAFINAKLYLALKLWGNMEELLKDDVHSHYYKLLAERLKQSFNRPIQSGGFWNPEKQWYIYWRDKDNSIHGNNLVTPVNFMAIAYGICDSVKWRDAILGQIEEQMQNENLMIWPLCFYPYELDEGYKVNYPFPNYENGDIFLAWGEVGIRAYQEYNPAIPLKYIKNVLKQYERDGLAFQRYSRKDQKGVGGDILANNCMPIVGLYRNIYGIQPQHNRLYINPHLTKELNGTQLKYNHRGQQYLIQLSLGQYSVTAKQFTVNTTASFGMDAKNNDVIYFNQSNKSPSMKIIRDIDAEIEIDIIDWKEEMVRKWSVETSGSKTSIVCYLYDLIPNHGYKIYQNGKQLMDIQSDSFGIIKYSFHCGPKEKQIFKLF